MLVYSIFWIIPIGTGFVLSIEDAKTLSKIRETKIVALGPHSKGLKSLCQWVYRISILKSFFNYTTWNNGILILDM